MSNPQIVAKRASSSRNPTPQEILAAREAGGLTQTQAALLVHASCRTWQQWEANDRRMHPAFWELFCIKVSGRSSLTGKKVTPNPNTNDNQPHRQPASL